jgi:ketosteroid isomerase-like protein
MSQENEKSFLDGTAAFNGGDLESWLGFFDAEIEWHDLPTLPGAGVHRGKAALRRRVEDWLETWGEPRVDIEEIRSVGDRVVARIQYTGIGKASGARTAPLTATQVAEYRNGRVLRSWQFVDHAEALEAAGLSE